MKCQAIAYIQGKEQVHISHQQVQDMKMRGIGGIQGVLGMETILEIEIVGTPDIEVPVEKIDIETTSKVRGKEIIPRINNIDHLQGVITRVGGTIETPVSPPQPGGHGMMMLNVNHDIVQGTLNGLMNHQDTAAEATLDPLGRDGDHLVPFLEIGIDQETDNPMDVVIPNRTQEVAETDSEKDVTPERDVLLVETVMDEEVIPEETRLDSRLGLNHLQHLDIGLPVLPELQKSLL